MTTHRAVRTVMLSTTGWVILTGIALGQGTGATPPSSMGPPSTTGQAPTTTGQAPREIQTPSGGHRQPTARDAPSSGNQAASHAANQEIDRRLNICRGC